MVEFQLPKLATRVRFPSLAPLCLAVLLTGCATVYCPDATSDMVRQGKGIYHVVEKGQTLWRISQAYDVDMEKIVAVNYIVDAKDIRKGQKIFIPGANRVIAVNALKEDLNRDEFKWPVRGMVLSYFQKGNTDFWKQGIRIKTGSQDGISAVRQGKVVFADDLMGYGSTVIIDHQDGFMSVYGNNARLAVRLGETVSKGDVIAEAPAGGDGFLYFEIRRKGKAVNPLFYLPKI